MSEFVETLDLNNVGRPNGVATALYIWIDFTTKKEISQQTFVLMKTS